MLIGIYEPFSAITCIFGTNFASTDRSGLRRLDRLANYNSLRHHRTSSCMFEVHTSARVSLGLLDPSTWWLFGF